MGEDETAMEKCVVRTGLFDDQEKMRRTILVELVAGRNSVATESYVQKSLRLESLKQLGRKLGLYKITSRHVSCNGRKKKSEGARLKFACKASMSRAEAEPLEADWASAGRASARAAK